jgi:hypothetical protein
VRVAFIKQALDVHGPWSTVRWNDAAPERLFDVWPGKATFWEMSCYLKADWYVIPQRLSTDYIQDVLRRIPNGTEKITRHVRNVAAPADIPIDRYDLVITFDPIWEPPAHSETLFAYFVVEHWDRLYSESLRAPLGRYDLFLAHMMDAPKTLESLPQALAFPYLRDPDSVRRAFSADKEDAIWADFRTLTTLGMAETYDVWVSTGHAAAQRLEEVLHFPVRYKGSFNESPYGISDPPAWGDAARYFEAMAGCKYYAAVGTIAGAGQAICDAASLGCLCIGQQDKAFHRLICHPAALCASMIDFPRRFRAIAGSLALQEEIRQHQDGALREFFQRRPLELLDRAATLKRRQRAAAPKSVLTAGTTGL